MTDSGLSALLRPASVAIVGASEDVRRFGGAAIHNLIAHGYEGEIFPVTPTRNEVFGRPAVPRLWDLPHAVDTAIVIVSADASLGVVAEAAEVGVRSVVMVASGFGEGKSGIAGHDRVRRLRELVAGTEIAILGPSTTGLSNLLDRYVPRASSNQLTPELVRPGSLALISQSGAVNNILYNRAQSHGVGISYAVATGVQALIDVWDVAGAVLEDGRVHAIAMALESVGPWPKAQEVCARAAELGVVISAIKLGQTEAGAAASASHSASLAGRWAIERAYLEAAGVLVADDLDQLWEIGLLADRWGPPARSASRVSMGVIAFSGGEGAIIADEVTRRGMELPVPSESFARRITDVSPLADVCNPFDPTGDVIGREAQFVECVRSFVADNEYDAYLIAAPIQGELLRGPMRKACAAVADGGRRVAASMWQVRHVSDGVEDDLHEDGFPLFDTSNRAIAAMARYLNAPPISGAGPGAARLELPWPAPGGMSYWEVREYLRSQGVPFTAARLVRRPADAVREAEALGLPVVLKRNVHNNAHKSSYGLVRVGLRTTSAVERAAAELLAMDVEGTLPDLVVEEFCFGTVQLLVGGSREPGFGPALLVGSGGSAVEANGEVAIVPAARTGPGILAIAQTPVGRLVADRPQAADQLARIISVVASLMANPAVTSVDINPVMINLSTDEVFAVDARIV